MPKLSQKCAKLKNVKNHKISTSRVKPGKFLKFPKGLCARVLSRPRQAQEPCLPFPSLLQLIPARSGLRSLAQLPRGSGRVPSIQGASQRSYKAQESSLVLRPSPGKLLLQPLGTVPRTENTLKKL